MKEISDLKGVNSFIKVRDLIVVIRLQSVILDSDVAALYGVETKRVNEAVRNNPDKFPTDYMFELTKDELKDLRSKISTAKSSTKSRALPKAFTEKGLYMLATILKSRHAIEATFSIIETFTKVRCLKKELIELCDKSETQTQSEKLRQFSDNLADIVMPDLDTIETESTLELDFFIGKIKHTVKRIKTH